VWFFFSVRVSGLSSGGSEFGDEVHLLNHLGGDVHGFQFEH
jgi:hypothetical protein